MTKKAPLQRAVGKRLPDGACGRRSTDCSAASQPAASDAEYKVGPGRPPREYRFKPGKSGNPKGAKPKPPSIAPDLKLALERALNKTVKLKQGKRSAGVERGDNTGDDPALSSANALNERPSNKLEFRLRRASCCSIASDTVP